APNVVQGSAKVHYLIRAPKVKQALDIFERMKQVAEGAALICGTESSYDVLTGLSDFISNYKLSTVLQESMEEIGAPAFDEVDFKQSKQLFETLTEDERQQINKRVQKHYSKEEAADILEYLLDTKIHTLNYPAPTKQCSKDLGDLSYETPTAQYIMATTVLRTSPHTWQMDAQGNTNQALKG